MQMASLIFLLRVLASLSIILVSAQLMVCPVDVKCSFTADELFFLCSSMRVAKGRAVSPI